MMLLSLCCQGNACCIILIVYRIRYTGGTDITYSCSTVHTSIKSYQALHDLKWLILKWPAFAKSSGFEAGNFKVIIHISDSGGELSIDYKR